MAESNSRAAQLAGLGVAGVGLAHFVKPELFESLTQQAFPENTQQHVYTDGAIETALGLGLIVPKTRKLALVGLLVYGGYLGANIIRNQ